MGKWDFKGEQQTKDSFFLGKWDNINIVKDDMKASYIDSIRSKHRRVKIVKWSVCVVIFGSILS